MWLDWKLPGMDGMEFITRLKVLQPKARAAPFIGHPSQEVTLRALVSGYQIEARLWAVYIWKDEFVQKHRPPSVKIFMLTRILDKFTSGSLAESRLTTFFVVSASAIFLVTGLAKMLSASGEAKLLATQDPVFRITIRQFMLLAGLCEIIAASVCLRKKDETFNLAVIASLATSLLAYRSSLWLTGWHSPCYCLGPFVEFFDLSEKTTDRISLSLLTYLVIGSYGLLGAAWLKSRNTGLCVSHHILKSPEVK